MKNKILNIKGFLIIFLVTITLIFILKFTSNDKALQEENAEVFLVETEKIILKDNSPEYLFYGNVVAQNQVDVISQLPGKIINISPKVLSNNYFEKGEKIFELDPFNYKQELIKKKSELEELRNELKSKNLIFSEIEKQQILSKKNYDRKTQLVGDIVTKKNLEDAATELSINNAKVLDIKSNIQTIISNIKIAESQVSLAQRNLKDTVYRAPFSGKLDNSFIEVGVEVSTGRILGKLLNTSDLNVQFFVGENIYTHISNILGKEAQVFWKKSNFKKNYLAKVFYIDSAINKERAGLNIKAKLEEISENDPIKPGVFVEVVIQGLAIKESFLVDENSIYEDTFIYVLEGNKAVRTKINVEGVAQEKIIITGTKLNNKKIILTRINNLNLYKKIISKN
ncbi:MAG: MexH family multidrug efflux RND transporter periplasmic adaptor subunit [Alphaproteobacteria bacterium]|nr:MAG: MexH family multidrug efflux RND transporter periplasmic adaptor subunit [Alphaproteobacteria bacterium]